MNLISFFKNFIQKRVNIFLNTEDNDIKNYIYLIYILKDQIFFIKSPNKNY